MSVKTAHDAKQTMSEGDPSSSPTPPPKKKNCSRDDARPATQCNNTITNNTMKATVNCGIADMKKQQRKKNTHTHIQNVRTFYTALQ